MILCLSVISHVPCKGGKMKNSDTKKNLLDAVTDLLEETENPEGITARQIAAKANVNLALISYYYGSKDALINAAIGQLFDAAAENWQDTVDETLPAKEKLIQALIIFSDIAVKYQHFTRSFLRYEVLENEITTPLFIVPFIRDYYGNSKDEYEIKLLAYQLVSVLQMVLLQADGFMKYIGENISEKQSRDRLIYKHVNQILYRGNENQETKNEKLKM